MKTGSEAKLLRVAGFVSAILLATPSLMRSANAASCESLASLALPDTTITLAQTVGAGELTPPPGSLGGPGRAGYKDMPAFCRVAATLKPSSDSDIRIEVWMPLSGWNGKYRAASAGGWGGIIYYPEMRDALRGGYATASTDTGHQSAAARGLPASSIYDYIGDGSFALGHPEKLIDFAYRSEHEMTVKAKAIIAAFYGNPPRYSYWNGCSTGGKQGLTEAQRYPADYDGIIAGAPSNYWTHLEAQSLWIAQAVHKDEASFIPPNKVALIHKTVLDTCDALDGVKDGVIGDPRLCHFDPKMLECKGADAPTCLTAPQAEAASKIYGPAVNPRTKQEVYPGLEPGSELGWAGLAGPEPLSFAVDYFRYVVIKNPNWDYKTLNFDSDITLADKIDHGVMNNTSPNLKPFFARGGKLLQYHGWSDQMIAPLGSVNYYESVLKAVGGANKVKDSYRLFMVPGMMHCGGGDGPTLDPLLAVRTLDQWVESGKVPDQIVASHRTNGNVDRTRPLCPYPQVASYKGTGSTDDAANFACKTP